jgi:fructoselysine 6-phosphate deglycase
MKELDQYVERAMTDPDSYFAVERAPTAYEDGLPAVRDACRTIAAELGAGVRNIYLTGAGGARANVVPLKAVFDRLLSIPTEEYQGYALVGQEPTQLGPDSLVFLASNTGTTEDTLAALAFAKERGARTVAICAKESSPLVQGTDAAVDFPHWDDNVMLPPLLIALELAEIIADAALADELRAGIDAVPAALRRAVALEVPRGEERARQFLNAAHVYVIGSGVLAPLAYKLAHDMLMENLRVGGSFIDALEYRHGPCESLERSHADMIFLVGTDWSREQTLRTLEACRRGGARTLVYDAGDYGELHPLLTPLVLYMAVQPFVINSAVRRGIVDLYARFLMGGKGRYMFEKELSEVR